MSIELYFSHMLEELADHLADKLAHERERSDFRPLARQKVIVPNLNVQTWLSLRIAERTGIAINTDFLFLEKGLWRMMTELESEPDSFRQLISQHELQSLVFAWLQRCTSGTHDPILQPLVDYLDAFTNQKELTRKQWQLARVLAHLIREYEYHRPAMIERWLDGPPSGSGPALEICQHRLYYDLFCPDGIRDVLADQLKIKYMTLFQYAREIKKHLSNPRDRALIKPDQNTWSVFGLSHFSHFHGELLFRLASAQLIDLSLYHLNVCREYWEDMTTPGEDRVRLSWQRMNQVKTISAAESDELEELHFENSLLKAWGKPGREIVKILSNLEEQYADHVEINSFWLESETGPVAERTPSVLASIQDQIVHRTEQGPVRPQDLSLQIVACPSLFREVELVYDSIIRNMAQNPDLMLNDIAVLVPDIAQYKPALNHIFGRDDRVPYNLVDSNAALDSMYGRAVKTLLGLFEGDFTRPEVFAVLRNPCFQARAGIRSDDVDLWLEWVERLHVYRESVKESTGPDDTGLVVPFTWTQALERLRFGRIMTTPEDQPRDGTFLDYNGLVPYADLKSSETDSLGMLCHLIDSLLLDLGQLQAARFSCQEWRQTIIALLNTYLDVPAAFKGERTVQKRLIAALDQLDPLGLMLDAAGARPEVELDLIASWIDTMLLSISGGRGYYLTGGVTIASLQPLRPIPFKIMYVLGLGEGSFPGKQERLTMDLRNRKRLIGDVSPLEAHYYLFLETLMSTRQKLYLSYISQDVAKYEKKFPGSIIQHLLNYLYKPDASESLLPAPFQIVETVPLRESSPAYLRPQAVQTDVIWSASTEARLLALFELSHTYPGRYTDLEQTLKPLLEGFAPDYSVTGSEPADVTGPVTIHIDDLVQFILNPIEATLKKRCAIRDDLPDDQSLKEDAPLYAVYPELYSLPVAALTHAVRTGADTVQVQTYLTEDYRHRVLCGALPAAAYGSIDLKRFQDNISQRLNGTGPIKQSLFDLIDSMQGKTLLENVTIGESRRRLPSDQKYPYVPVCIAGLRPDPANQLEFRLSGDLPLVWRDPNGFLSHVLIITHKKVDSSKRGQILKEMIRPFLFIALATLSGIQPEQTPFIIHISHKQGLDRVQYPGFSKDFCLEYFQELVRAMFSEQGYDLLPFEPILGKSQLMTMINASLENEEACSASGSEFNDILASLVSDKPEDVMNHSQIGEILRLVSPQIPTDAYKKCCVRYKPLLQGQVG
ncbi:exodeoxyribonuclease V subunit gamma [bacterium]|nr:exodeoxyribonuclease V subunit gamma [bacterium]